MHEAAVRVKSESMVGSEDCEKIRVLVWVFSCAVLGYARGGEGGCFLAVGRLDESLRVSRMIVVGWRVR